MKTGIPVRSRFLSRNKNRDFKTGISRILSRRYGLHARAFASFAYKSPLAVRQTGGGLAPVVQRAQRARKPQRWPRNDCETHQNDVGLALRFVSHDSTLFYAQGCAVRARRKPGSPQLPPIWACLLQTPKGERTK